MQTIATRPLLTMPMRSKRRALGNTQFGERAHVAVTEARLEGPGINAHLVSAGDDWVSVTPDGTRRLDCRLMFETDDGALIGVSYRGIRHAPPDILQREAAGEALDPFLFYHRVAIFFETATPRYAHLNQMIAIGRVHRTQDGGVYEVFEVL